MKFLPRFFGGNKSGHTERKPLSTPSAAMMLGGVSDAVLRPTVVAIADIAIFPWIRTLRDFYQAGDLVSLSDFSNVLRALEDFLSRPAVIRGIDVPKRD